MAPDSPETDSTAESGAVDGEADMAAGDVDDTGAQQAPEEMDEAVAPADADEAMSEQDEPAAPEEPEPVAEAAPEQEPAPVQKPFPGNIIDAISNSVLYQVALGGGLIVLLVLLLLLARRNANREKAFYDQLNSESEGDESDSFDLTFDEDETAGAPETMRLPRQMPTSRTVVTIRRLTRWKMRSPGSQAVRICA
jgi:pilus assembly protein FimV